MQFKLFKIIFILSLILYHSVSISKAAISNNFNQKYLSNYFSGLVSYDNQDNDLALKFFESSKALIKKHPSYLKQYVFSLVLDGQIAKATKQINFWKNINQSKVVTINEIIDSKFDDFWKNYKSEFKYKFLQCRSASWIKWHIQKKNRE